MNQYLKNGNKPIDEINHVLQTICTRTGANIPKNLTILSPSLIKWENCSTVILHEKMSQSGVTLTSTENEEKSGDKTYFAVVQKIYLETSSTDNSVLKV